MTRSEAHLSQAERHGRAIGRGVRDHDIYLPPDGRWSVWVVMAFAVAAAGGLSLLMALTTGGLLL